MILEQVNKGIETYKSKTADPGKPKTEKEVLE